LGKGLSPPLARFFILITSILPIPLILTWTPETETPITIISPGQGLHRPYFLYFSCAALCPALLRGMQLTLKYHL
jgi:hypothetical protein